MNRLTISIPEQMSDWVDAQVDTGRYGNVSEYFRDLVRRDQEQRESAVQELRSLLDAAEKSGIAAKNLPEILEAARKEARHKGLLGDEA